MSEEDRVAKLEKKVQNLEIKLADVEAKCSPRMSMGAGTYTVSEETSSEEGEEATETESTKPSEGEAEATPSDQE